MNKVVDMANETADTHGIGPRNRQEFVDAYVATAAKLLLERNTTLTKKVEELEWKLRNSARNVWCEPAASRPAISPWRATGRSAQNTQTPDSASLCFDWWKKRLRD